MTESLTTDEYHFFWNGPFSQHDIVFLKVNYEEYNCAEQYMMATKAKIFKDYGVLQEIMAVTDPRDHKKLGRQIKNFDSAIWDEHKEDVVYDGNLAKFTQNPAHHKALINTGSRLLVEASPYDGIWGIKMAINDPEIRNPKAWKGENLLGEILTALRDSL